MLVSEILPRGGQGREKKTEAKLIISGEWTARVSMAALLPHPDGPVVEGVIAAARYALFRNGVDFISADAGAALHSTVGRARVPSTRMSVVAAAPNALRTAVGEVGLHVVIPMRFAACADVRAVVRTRVPSRSSPVRTVTLVALLLTAKRVHVVSGVAGRAFVLPVVLTLVACHRSAVRARALDTLRVSGSGVERVARGARCTVVLSVRRAAVPGGRNAVRAGTLDTLRPWSTAVSLERVSRIA